MFSLCTLALIIWQEQGFLLAHATQLKSLQVRATAAAATTSLVATSAAQLEKVVVFTRCCCCNNCSGRQWKLLVSWVRRTVDILVRNSFSTNWKNMKNSSQPRAGFTLYGSGSSCFCQSRSSCFLTADPIRKKRKKFNYCNNLFTIFLLFFNF